MNDGAGLERSLADYLDALASHASTPGGGSVSGIVGALAIALGQMVVAFSETNDDLSEAGATLRDAREHAAAFAIEDELAYGNYIAATWLPKATAEDKAARRLAMQSALRHAAETPLALAELVAGITPVIDRVAEIGNPHLVSDAAIARILADAAIACALVNVRVNIPHLKDEAVVEHLETRIAALEA